MHGFGSHLRATSYDIRRQVRGFPDTLLQLCPLKVSFCFCKYATTSKTLNIFLQPIDQGINVPRLRNVSLHSPGNKHFKLWCFKKVQVCSVGVSRNPSFNNLLAVKTTLITCRRKITSIALRKTQESLLVEGNNLYCSA